MRLFGWGRNLCTNTKSVANFSCSAGCPGTIRLFEKVKKYPLMWGRCHSYISNSGRQLQLIKNAFHASCYIVLYAYRGCFIIVL